MVWEADNGCLTIEPVDDLRELQTQVKATGGFIITHTARLAQRDGQPFTAGDVRQFWCALFRFLWFVAGRRMNAILPIGFDSTGQPIWTVWGPWSLDPWKAHDSWADLHHADELGAVFEGYMKLRADPKWEKSVDLAIYWYTESNRNPHSIETNIIVTQVALERLAWEHLVRNGSMTNSQFKKMSAQQQITHLLTALQIPTAIPVTCKDLLQHNWSDAIHALTKLRNDIVHPEKKIIDPDTKQSSQKGKPKVTDHVLWECRQCSLRILELVLLRSFDYNGVYADRCAAQRSVGSVQNVPWNP